MHTLLRIDAHRSAEYGTGLIWRKWYLNVAAGLMGRWFKQVSVCPSQETRMDASTLFQVHDVISFSSRYKDT